MEAEVRRIILRISRRRHQEPTEFERERLAWLREAITRVRRGGTVIEQKEIEGS